MPFFSRTIPGTRALQIFGTGLLIVGLTLSGAGCGGAGSNGSGGGGGGGGGGGSDTTPPAIPGDLTSDASDGAVTLAWDGVDNADTYSVYRSTSSTDGVSGSALDTDLSSTSYDDESAENGTTYFYRVTAVDEAGNESDGSDEVQGTPFAKPTDLEGNSGDSQVGLTWSAAAGAETYNVYRSGSSTDGATGDPLTTGVSDSTYVDSTAENGTKYYYRVTTVNPEDEESPGSNEVGKAAFSDPPDRP